MTDLALSTLAEAEAVIERGLATFVEVGQALIAIRDGRLYRESHGTFEDYCRERWAFSKRHANRLVEASEVAGILEIVGPMGPTSERQVRALAPLKSDPDKLAEAWTEAIETSNGKPTAKAVEAVVERVTAPALTEEEQIEQDRLGAIRRTRERLFNLITGWIALTSLGDLSYRDEVLESLQDPDRERVLEIEAIYQKGTA